MSDTDTVRAQVLRNFTDAGTERAFEADQVVDLTKGEFANYRAAGVVDAAPEEAPAAASDETLAATPKTGRSRN